MNSMQTYIHTDDKNVWDVTIEYSVKLRNIPLNTRSN